MPNIIKNDIIKKVKYSSYSSPVGKVHVVASGAGLCRLGFGDEFLRIVKSDYGDLAVEDSSGFLTLFDQFDEYFKGRVVDFDLGFDICGTNFQKSVWTALRTVPYGTVVSYARLAEMAGFSAGAARAVGSACGNNPLPIVIPCHRVVRSDGAIGGFSQRAGGVEMKRKLLGLEGALLNK